MNPRPIILLFCAVLVASATPALADRVTTTSGQTFQGKVVEQDKDKVVLKTESGNVVIPRAAIKSADMAVGEKPAGILAETIDPLRATKAYQDAEAAMKTGNWVRAGSLLEGLMQLDSTVFAHEDRAAAAASLATCYLQVRDPEGAARSFERRARLVDSPSDRKRLQATAEAIRKGAGVTVGGVAPGPVTIGTTPVAGYDEAIAAAMNWKAAQVLEQAKTLALKATGLDSQDRLDEATRRSTDRLAEADLYVPGYSLLHRKEVLQGLSENILQAARRAVEIDTEERKDLSRFWRTTVASPKVAMDWNEKASRYLARRQAAEDGLKNLKAFADRQKLPDLYSEKEGGPLLTQLDDLQYHLLMPGMVQRHKIALRRIGSEGRG